MPTKITVCPGTRILKRKKYENSSKPKGEDKKMLVELVNS
jgi:hypothetical protein